MNWSWGLACKQMEISSSLVQGTQKTKLSPWNALTVNNWFLSFCHFSNFLSKTLSTSLVFCHNPGADHLCSKKTLYTNRFVDHFYGMSVCLQPHESAKVIQYCSTVFWCNTSQFFCQQAIFCRWCWNIPEDLRLVSESIFWDCRCQSRKFILPWFFLDFSFDTSFRVRLYPRQEFLPAACQVFPCSFPVL